MTDIKTLQKSLRDKTSECDTLKKKLDRFERDRQQWESQKRTLESKQPMDVQMLQREKRELTMQLDREQIDKQELFLQMNTLIARAAEAERDTADQQSNDALKTENDSLKEQLGNIQKIQSQLNNDVHSLQEELRRKTKEVDSYREDLKRRNERVEEERSKLEDNVDQLQRDLEMKSAALQSLMLAKQEKKPSEADEAAMARLTSDNEDLKKQLTDTAKQLVAESGTKSILNQKIEELSSKLDVMEDQVTRQQTELVNARKELEVKAAEAQRQSEQYHSSDRDHEGQVGKLQNELKEQQMANEAMTSEMKRLEETMEHHQNESALMRVRMEESQKTVRDHEEMFLATKVKGETASKGWEEQLSASETKLKTTRQRVQELEDELEQHRDKNKDWSDKVRSQEMKTAEAELEMKRSNIKVQSLEMEMKSLQNQLDAQHGVDDQVKNLREELRLAGQRNAALMTAMQKTENEADEADRSNRETIEELEEEIRSLHEKLSSLELNEEALLDKIAKVEGERTELEDKGRNEDSALLRATKDLEVSRAEVSRMEMTLNQFRAENAKLLAKASLEDEVLTLATSLQTARNDISTKRSELDELHTELRELRDENERLKDNDHESHSLRLEVENSKQRLGNLTEEAKTAEDAHITRRKELEEQLSKLRNDIMAKDAEKAEQRSELELRHQQSLIEVRKHHEDQVTGLEHTIESLKKKNESENDELKKNIQEMEKAAERAGEERSGQVTRLIDHTAQLNIELRALKRTVSGGERKKHELESEIMKLIEDNRAKGLEITELRTRSNQLQMEVNSLKMELEQSRSSKRTTELDRKLQADNSTLTEELGRSAHTLRERQHEIRQLKLELQCERGERESAINRHHSMTEKIEELEQELVGLKGSEQVVQQRNVESYSLSETRREPEMATYYTVPITTSTRIESHSQKHGSSLVEGNVYRIATDTDRAWSHQLVDIDSFRGSICEGEPSSDTLVRSPEIGEPSKPNRRVTFLEKRELSQQLSSPMQNQHQTVKSETVLMNLSPKETSIRLGATSDESKKLQRELEELRDDNASLVSQLEELTDDCEALKLKVAIIEQRNNEAQGLEHNLRAQVQDAETMVEKIRVINKQEVQELCDRIGEMKDQRSKALEDASLLRQQLELARMNLAEMTAEKDSMERPSLKVSPELEAVPMKIDNDTETSAQRTELPSLKERVTVEQYHEAYSRRGDPHFNTELTVLKRSPDLAAGKVEKHAEVTSMIREEVPQLKATSSSIRDYSVVDNELKTTQEELEKYKVAKRSLEMELSAVCIQHETLRRNAGEMEKRFIEAESKSDNAQANLESVKNMQNAMLEEKSREIESLRSRLNAVSQEDGRGRELSHIPMRLQRHTKQLTEAVRERDTAKRQAVVLEQEFEQFKQSVACQQYEQAYSQRGDPQVNKELLVLTRSSDMPSQKLQMNLEPAPRVKKEVFQLKTSLTNAENDRVTISNALKATQQQLVECQEAKKSVEVQLSTLCIADEALRCKMRQFERHCIEAESDAAVAKADLESYQRKLNDMTNESNTWKETMRERNAAQTEVKLLRCELSSLQQSAAAQQVQQVYSQRGDPQINKELVVLTRSPDMPSQKLDKDVEAAPRVKKELSQLKGTLAIMETDRLRIGNELRATQEQFLESESAKKSLEIELNSLRMKDEAVCGNVHDIEKRCMAAELSAAAARTSLEEKTSEIQQLQLRLNELNNESNKWAEVMREKNSAQSQVKQLRCELASFQQTAAVQQIQQVYSLRGDPQVNKELLVLSRSPDMPQQKLAVNIEPAPRVSPELSQLKVALHNVENDRIRTTNELQSIRAQLSECQAAKKSLEIELQNLRMENETLHKDVQKIEKRCMAAELGSAAAIVDLEKKNREVQQLEIRLNELTSESKKWTEAVRERSSAQSEVQALRCELSSLQQSATLQQYQQVYSQRGDPRMNEELLILKRSSDMPMQKLDKEIEAAPRVRKEMVQLKTSLDGAEKEKNVILKELNSTQEQLSEYKAFKKSLEIELANSNMELETIRHNMQEIEKRCADAESSSSAAKANLESMRNLQTTALAARTVEIDRLQRKLNASIDDKSNAEAELSSLHAQFESVQEQLCSAQNEKNAIYNQSKVLNEKLERMSLDAGGVQQEKSQAEASVAQWKNQLECSQRMLSSTAQQNKHLQDRVKMLQVEILTMKGTVEASNARRADSVRGDATLNEELVILKRSQDMPTDQFDRSSETMMARKQVAQMKVQLQDVHKQEAQTMAETSTLREQLRTANFMLTGLKRDNDGLKTNIQSFETRSKESGEQLQSLKSHLAIVEKERDDLKTRMNGDDQQQQDLSGRLEDTVMKSELNEKENRTLKDQIKLLKVKITEAESKNQQVDSNLPTMKTDLDVMKRRLSEEEGERNRLKNELLDLRVKTRVAEEKVAAVVVEKQDLNSQITSMSQKIRTQDEELSKRENNLSKLESDLMNLRNEMNKTAREASVTNDVALKQAVEESSSHKLRIEALLAESMRWKELAKSHDDDVQKARRQAEDHQKQLTANEQLRTSLEKELKELKADNEEQKRIDEEHSQIEIQRYNETQLLRKDLNEARTVIASNKRFIDEKERDVEIIKKDSEKLLEELTVLRQGSKVKKAVELENHQLLEQLNTSKAELRRLELSRKRLEEDTRKAESERRRAEGELSDVKATLAQVEAHQQHSLTQIERTETELVEMRTHSTALRAGSNAHSAQMNSLNNELNKARQKYANAKNELTRLRQEHEELKLDAQKRQQNLEQVTAERSMMRASLDASSTETRVLQRERAEHESALRRVSQLEAVANERNKEVQELRDRIKVLNECGKTTAALTRSLDKVTNQKHSPEMTTSTSHANSSSIRSMEVERVRVIEEKERLLAERASERRKMDDMSRSNTELSSNVKRLTSLLEIESKRVESFTSEKRSHEMDIAKMKDERDRLEREARELRVQDKKADNDGEMKRKVSELMAENARLAGEVLKGHHDSDRESKGVEDLRQEFTKRLKTRDEEWQRKVEEERTEKAKEIDKIKSDLAIRVQHRDDEWRTKVEAQMASKNTELDSLKLELVKRKSSVSTSDAEMQRMKHQIETKESEMETLRKRNESKESEMETLRKRNESKESEMETLRRKNDDLVRERDQAKTMAQQVDVMSRNSQSLSKQLHESEERLKRAEEEKRKLKESLGDAESSLKECKENISKMKPNGASPAPAPRRSHAVSDMSETIQSLGALDENKKLKADLEKQRRLIVVLRRKLQAAQPS